LEGFTITNGDAIYGGGMYNEDSSPTISNCTFSGNAADYGGGMFNYAGSNPVLINCTFIANSADQQAGGMYNTVNSSPTISNCTFSGNKAAALGGGMLNYSSSNPLLIDCTFIANSVFQSGGKGGGMYNNASDPNLLNCSFVRNKSTAQSNLTHYGGGIYNLNSSPYLYECEFIENLASLRGGGIYNDSNCNPTLDRCTFIRNYATMYITGSGGGIHGWSSSIINCIFIGNRAYQGGAILGAAGILTNCTFSVNYARQGGAIYKLGDSLTVSNCTFIANSAGDDGGGICAIDGILSVNNCILWNNTDAGGTDESAQIHTEGGTPVVGYCCVEGLTGELGGVGNIGDNPMFVREPNDGGDGWGDNTTTININEGLNDDYGTFHLLPGSPCIDAGDNAAVPPDTTDLDDDGNTSESIPWDLYGDARFADDTDSPDTGSGTPPIVDMGAYESPKQGFLLSTELLTIPEGGTVTFTVSLRLDPLGIFEATVFNEALVFNIPGDKDITVQSGASLVFNSSNYSAPQTVTLYASEDNDNFDMPTSIAVAALGVVASRVNVIERDNEPNANTIFVDADAPGANDGSTWENAYTALQDALDKAVSVGLLINHIRFTDFEIWVAQGTYKPDQGAGVTPGYRTAAFKLLAGVPLRGGFAGFGEPGPDARDVELYETFLSGDLDGDDVGDMSDPSRSENSYHVGICENSPIGQTVELDGFTISGGNANAITSDYWSGGGLYIYNGNPIIKNCKFQHNRASGGSWGGGGAVYCSSANTTITDCNFTQNLITGDDGGGAICNYSGNLQISNCAFNNNSASGSSGGAIYSEGILNINNESINDKSNFNNNRSSSGGAIYTNNSNSIIADCTFTGNSAGKGGGVFSSGTTTNCTFNNNSAILGGGMYNSGTVINCTFSEHSITGEDTGLFGLCGGGMYNMGTVTDCTFIENSLANTGTWSSSYGGGIYNVGVSPTVSNCVFIRNSVAADGQSSHGYGGGLYNSADTPNVTNCEFIANSSTHYGGGLANYESSSTIANCTFIANTAASNGGGLHNEHGCTTTTVNCSFAGNSALNGNALACSSWLSPAIPSTIEVANSILWDGGNEIQNFDGSTITVGYSDIQSGWQGQGNIDADPCFVASGYWDPNGTPADDSDDYWVDGDYRLTADSPCIDTGDPNYSAGPNETDLDGNPRVCGGCIDMGAYELQDPTSGPPAPSGVSASDGTYCGSVRVSWDLVSGATAYEVWRSASDDSGSASKIADDTSSPYDDSVVAGATPYYYWVKAKNSSGTSGFSLSDSGYASSAPPAPSGVSASDGTYCGSVQVSWDPVSGATAYEVWRHTSNNSGSASKIADDTSSPYDDSTVAVRTTYYYWVKAKNSCGTSGFSLADSGYGSSAPPAPSGALASDGTYCGSVQVSWAPVSGATSYEVWRNVSNDVGSASKIGDDTSSPYDDSSVAGVTVYYYWVKAENSCGTSGFSPSDSGYASITPGAPSGALASDGTYCGSVQVSWDSVSGATAYEIWRNTSDDAGSASKIADDSSAPYDDSSVVVGTIYYYWVKAKSICGTSGFSPSDSGYASDISPAPTGVSASDGTYCGSVQVSWDLVSGATAYEIWRNTSDSAGSASKIADDSSPAYDDSSVAVRTTYYYWVKAKSSCDTSGFSLSDSGYASSTPPAPAGALASDGTYCGRIEVSWNSVSGATAYEIWRNTNNDAGSASKIADDSSAPYDDSSVAGGTTYHYWIKATNSCGTSGFSPSDSGYASSAPSAPAGAYASDGTYHDKVEVSWTSVSGATGYEIWRNTSNDAGSASKMADDSSAPYDDSSVVVGTIYYYWVKAKNDCGTSGFSSPDSGYAGSPPTISDAELLDQTEALAADYFFEQALSNGLVKDYDSVSRSSIAATGFGLTAFAIMAERYGSSPNWTYSPEQLRDRTNQILDTLIEIQNGQSASESEYGKEGLFYHFIEADGTASGGSEVSTADTAILFAGVITAGEYFGGEVKQKAAQIVGAANWAYFLKTPSNDFPSNNGIDYQFTHGWKPSTGIMTQTWDRPTDEAILISVIALASNLENADFQKSLFSWPRVKRSYGGYEVVNSYFGSLFTYVIGHVWIDFELIGSDTPEEIMPGVEGVAWWQNSVNAAKAARQFAIDNSGTYGSYGPDSWGLSEVQEPNGHHYQGLYGALPTDSGTAFHNGTIAPYSSISTIALFKNEDSGVLADNNGFRVLRHFYDSYYWDLWGQYGPTDSFNSESEFSQTCLGIHQGQIVAMIENYRTGFVWEEFLRNEQIEEALAKLFEYVPPAVCILLDDDFDDGAFDGWSIVDHGKRYAPSDWSAASGEMVQSSNIYSPPTGGGQPAKLGTYAWYPAGIDWRDYLISLSMKSEDDDAMGVMFRCQNGKNYYRFSWDKQRNYRRLVKRVKGRTSVLAEDYVPYVPGQWYDIEIVAQGTSLEVYINGALIFSVTDSSLSSGTIALYCWANGGSHFDDIVVENLSSVNLGPVISSVTATPPRISDDETCQLQVDAHDQDCGPSPLSYSWTVQAGEGSLDDPNIPNPVYTPPDVTCARTFTLTVEVSDGNDTVISPVDVRVRDGDTPSLSCDGWEIVDHGDLAAPSDWSCIDGGWWQSSNIYSLPTGTELPKLGTYVWYTRGVDWTDYSVTLDIMSDDDDDVGLMFRCQNGKNYYRFSWDKQRNYRRLVKRVNGRTSLLAEDNVPYVPGQWYDIEVVAQGSSLEVYVDCTLIFSVTDSSLSSGTVALYSWANAGGCFENISFENLSPVNLPPVISSVTATACSISDYETSQLQVDAYDLDFGPSALSYSWTVQPGEGSLDDPSIANPVYTPPDVSSDQTFTLTVEVSDGNDAVASSVDVTVRDGDVPVLLWDDFCDGDCDGWVTVDHGTIGAPSDWSCASGSMYQSSNLYSLPTGAELPKLGTYVWYPAGTNWTDYSVLFRMRSEDDDALGLMFRCQNGKNYYRFSWDSQRNYRRLVKRVNGRTSLLAEDNVPYVSGQWYNVEIFAQGNSLEVYVDGTPVFSVTDNSLSSGTIALYCWGNAGSWFDNILVEDLLQ
jgi:fibronectin type 3 domain-containing protein